MSQILFKSYKSVTYYSRTSTIHTFTLINYYLFILLYKFIVKRAYHRCSLKVHPDRVPENEKVEATEKFKVISAIHSVLSNKSKREIYDKTGT